MTRQPTASRLNRRRLIAGLCLVLFQVQLFAASTLGCLHDASTDRSVGCPFHIGMPDGGGDRSSAPGSGASGAIQTPAGPSAVDAATAADTDLLDCPRCALQLGLHHLFSHEVELTVATPPRADAWPLPRLHYYRFVSDLIIKPPIPADA